MEFNEIRKQQWPDPDRYNANALCGMNLRNVLRALCIYIIESRWWQATSLFVVLGSTLCLAFEDPLDTVEWNPKSQRRDILETFSKVFSVIFLFDVIVNIIALGFISGKLSYLRDPFNWIDLTIAVMLLVPTPWCSLFLAEDDLHSAFGFLLR